MKRNLFLLLLVLTTQLTFAQNQRSTYNFNPGWKVFVGDATGAEATNFDDKTWKGITLPYAWNEDEAFKKSIEELSTGIAWYRKHFTLPAGSTDKKIFLEIWKA